jgi:CRISPR system Cascade subunit CasA
MTPIYSLLHEAWIPVATSRAERALIRLDEISRADLVAIATGRPDCDISLTEFLIGLIAVACPPEDASDWRKGFSQAPTSAQVKVAFEPFADALVLDGEGPRFFQDREELQGDTTEIEALCVDVVAKHFTKPGRVEVLSRAGAAIVLATLQTSAPAGGAGNRTSLRGGGPLTTLVVPGGKPGEAHALWHLLWANLPIAQDEKPDPNRVFPWLVPTRVSDKSGSPTSSEDVDRLQAFFGMPRRIRLAFEPNPDKRRCDLLGIVDDVIVTKYVTRPWGTNYEGWSKGHPLSPYYRTKPTEPYLPVHLKSSRVGYRDWLGIALGDDDQTRVPAQCVFDFRRRLNGKSGELALIRNDARLLVAGYAMDNMKPLDFGEALMPFIVGSTDDVNRFVRGVAERMIDAAQETASLLVGSVKLGLFGKDAKAGTGSTVLSPVRDRFWADTEQDFFAKLSASLEKAEHSAASGDDDAFRDAVPELKSAIGADWLIVLRRHAQRIFDDNLSIDDADPRRVKDVVQARRDMLTALAGYGAPGKRIYEALGIPVPAKTKKPKADKSRNERAP